MLAGALVAKEYADVGAAPLGVLCLAIEALLNTPKQCQVNRQALFGLLRTAVDYLPCFRAARGDCL